MGCERICEIFLQNWFHMSECGIANKARKEILKVVPPRLLESGNTETEQQMDYIPQAPPGQVLMSMLWMTLQLCFLLKEVQLTMVILLEVILGVQRNPSIENVMEVCRCEVFVTSAIQMPGSLLTPNNGS